MTNRLALLAYWSVRQKLKPCQFSLVYLHRSVRTYSSLLVPSLFTASPGRCRHVAAHCTVCYIAENCPRLSATIHTAFWELALIMFPDCDEPVGRR